MAITVAVACRFYSGIMTSKPDSFKYISNSIREGYSASEGYCGIKLSCITDTVVKKVGVYYTVWVLGWSSRTSLQLLCSCLAALLNPHFGATCCANPTHVGGDATVTNIPHAVLDGVIPVDVPDCDCVVTPLHLRRNDRALICDKEWRGICRDFRINDVKLPIASRLATLHDLIKHLGESKPSAANSELIKVVTLLHQLLSRGHSSFKDCKSIVSPGMSLLQLMIALQTGTCSNTWVAKAHAHTSYRSKTYTI